MLTGHALDNRKEKQNFIQGTWLTFGITVTAE
jgi:hypothetical protein